MMKLLWLFRRILFALKQTPRRVWRLFTFYKHPFYKIYPPSVKWASAGLLFADLVFFFDFFEIVSNLISPNSRLLTDIEIQRGLEIFGKTIDFKLVMYDKRSLPVKRGMAHAYVTFNTVNSFRPIRADIFIHELVHVWQYQNFGAGYIAAALEAQKMPGGYNYTHTEGWHEGAFFDLNAEQQADFIQDIYLRRKGYYPQWRKSLLVMDSDVHDRFMGALEA
jgi:hypothetical protein